MQKILVIQTAFTGDVVLATAVIEKLHRFYPEAAIDFLVRKGNEGLFDGHPFLHDVLIWDKKRRKYANLVRLLGVVRQRKYDLVVNLQRFASTGWLTGLSQAKERIGFRKNPLSFLFTKRISHRYQRGIHEVERNNRLIEFLTDGTVNRPKLYPTAKHEEAVSEYRQEPYVCMTPASVWFTKQYPEEKWVELADHFPQTYHLFLLGGASDRPLCERIKAKTVNQKVTVLAGSLDFLSSAALMQGAHMNYTNDSAPLHFASATNAPVTAIFCSTVPEFGFYPLSDTSTVVQTTLTLSCKPCTLHGRKACPLGHFQCGQTIETAQLLATLND